MAYSLQPLINGVSHSWADIAVGIAGAPIIGITTINYEQKQDKVNLWGAGNQPVSYSNNKKEATCSITIRHEELKNLRESWPTKQIVDIPLFDITVTFLDASYTVFTHVIRNCRFMNDPVNSNQGDPSIDCQLNIVCSHIEY